MEAKQWNIFWVTLYCDASYSDTYGGAWSVWLRSNKGRIIRSGKCPESVTDCTMAELYAALMGVTIARDEWDADAVQINTDCSAVVDAAGKGYRWLGRKELRQLQDKILRCGPKLRTKHVKAHTGRTDTRSYLNQKCDDFANQARRKSGI